MLKFSRIPVRVAAMRTRPMDVLVLALIAVSGMYGASIGLVAVAALALTAQSSKRKLEIARSYRCPGTTRALTATLLLSFANNLIFTLLSFGLGHAVRLLA